MKILSCTKWPGHNIDYRIEIETGFWRWKSKSVYRGSCTVWHRYPGGERATSFYERAFADAWTAAEWDAYGESDND